MKPCLSYEHFEILARILEETSENPADEDGWTPLHLAAYRGQVDLCQKKIEEINYTHRPSNNDIWSPLQWTCLKGHIEVVNLILDKTTIPVNGFWIDKELNTILHFRAIKKIEKDCGCPGTRALIIAHHGDQWGVFLR